jgi:hemoglobin
MHNYRTLSMVATLLIALSNSVQSTAAQDQTLYQRLGGYDAITAVVTEFADRLFKDPKLERFFGGMSTDTRKRFKQLNIELVCASTGGPCEYLGRSMPQAHQGSGIGDVDFDQVAGHLVATLDKFKVPKKEKDELLAIIGGLRPAIVKAK